MLLALEGEGKERRVLTTICSLEKKKGREDEA